MTTSRGSAATARARPEVVGERDAQVGLPARVAVGQRGAGRRVEGRAVRAQPAPPVEQRGVDGLDREVDQRRAGRRVGRLLARRAGHGHDHRRRPRCDPQEALRVQLVVGLDHDAARDAELGGQHARGGQPHAGAQRAEPDRVAEPRRELVAERLGAVRSRSTSSSEGPLVRLTRRIVAGSGGPARTCRMSELIRESDRRGRPMAEHQGPRPLNRRDLLAGAGTGILAIYLVGCGGSSSKLAATGHRAGHHRRGRHDGRRQGGDRRARASATGGTPGGKLVVVFQAEGNSNDPAIGYIGTSWDSICNLTYAPLYTYSQSNDPQPQLRGGPAEDHGRRPHVHDPAARRRDVPQRAARRGRGLRLRVGSRARIPPPRAGRPPTSS